MFKRQTSLRIRKAHRFLGLFTGIQFLFWTISGIYFSWTNIDDIHGNSYKNKSYEKSSFSNLKSPSELQLKDAVSSIELRTINNEPYYWVNNHQLFNARTGVYKDGISKKEAISIAEKRMQPDLIILDASLITKAGSHHEYRKKLLPAYVVSFKHHQHLKAYVSVADGKFQTVRHRSWRWFDFLWMTHTMDYQGRDNFNTLILRAFSLLGLLTVLSGFVLWMTTKPLRRKK